MFGQTNIIGMMRLSNPLTVGENAKAAQQNKSFQLFRDGLFAHMLSYVAWWRPNVLSCLRFAI